MPDQVPPHNPFSQPNQLSAAKAAGNDLEPKYYPGRGVSVRYGAPTVENPGAADPRVTIVILLEPTAICELAWQTSAGESRQGRLQNPSVAVIGVRVPHTLRAADDKQIVTLYLESRFVQESTTAEVTGVTLRVLSGLGESDALIAQLTDVFRSLRRGERRSGALTVESVGTLMAEHLLQNLFDGEAPAERRSGLPTDAWQRVITYIDEHYTERFDLDALARISGFSRNHFLRLFRRSLDQTPREYVRGCQVQHAIGLLQTTRMKGIDIALACGFCDETQMARWFWALRRCVPGQARAAARR